MIEVGTIVRIKNIDPTWICRSTKMNEYGRYSHVEGIDSQHVPLFSIDDICDTPEKLNKYVGLTRGYSASLNKWVVVSPLWIPEQQDYQWMNPSQGYCTVYVPLTPCCPGQYLAVLSISDIEEVK